jgi:hypothetical protein
MNIPSVNDEFRLSVISTCRRHFCCSVWLSKWAVPSDQQSLLLRGDGSHLHMLKNIVDLILLRSSVPLLWYVPPLMRLCIQYGLNHCARRSAGVIV